MTPSKNLSLPNVEPIHETYFISTFNELVREKIITLEKSRHSARDYEEEYELYLFHHTSKEDLKILDEALFETCLNYIARSKSRIQVISHDPHKLVSEILEHITQTEDAYKESFLFSLQLIFNQYVSVLGRGEPISCAEYDKTEEPVLEVVTNKRHEIVTFTGINMEELERCQIINQMVKMERNNQIGPHPKVRQKMRTDI